MGQMQGAEDEAEGSILKYVTEAEFRKQRRRWLIMTHRLFNYLVRRDQSTHEFLGSVDDSKIFCNFALGNMR